MTPLHTIAIISILFIGCLAVWSIWNSFRGVLSNLNLGDIR